MTYILASIIKTIMWYHKTFTIHSRLSEKNFDRNKNECFLLLFIGGAATS